MILAFLISILFLSYFLTFFVRKIAIKRNIIDSPNERSSHSIPTPRGGGLAIVIIWYIVLFFLFFYEQIEFKLFLALLSGLILAITSFIDDIADLKPQYRLIAQAISSFSALYFLDGLFLFPNLDIGVVNFLINIFVFVGIIWFINLFNFLDGIDAYASIEAILISIGIYIVVQDLIILVFIVSIAGFLIWNWPKAKIFLGDIGSTQLGFIIVVFGIYYHNTVEFSIYNWLIITSLFWFDATFTLFRRWRNGEKLSQAHKKHAYQRLVQGGFSHLKVDIYAITINILLLGIVIINQYYIKFDIYLLLLILVLLYFLNKRIDNIFPFSNN